MLRAWLPIAALLLSVLVPSAPAQTLIAHPGVAETRISLSTARGFFYLRKRAWPNGTQIRLFTLPDDHPLHIAFCKQILGVLPHNLRQTWDRLVFAGLGQGPQRVRSPEEMRALVAATPGAIGYLADEAIDGTIRPLIIEKEP